MVTLYGMAETVGQRTYKPAPQGFLTGQVLDKPVASEATLGRLILVSAISSLMPLTKRAPF